MKKILLMVSLLAAFWTGTCAQAKEINLLCLGNSFTRNATLHLPEMVKSFPDCRLNLFIVYKGGSTLAYHWNRIASAENDPNVVYVKYGGKEMKTLQELLEAQKWDVIVLLQQYGGIKERFSDAESEPAATEMYNYVRKYSPHSEIMIHQTWTYRETWRSHKKWGESTPVYQAMYDIITAYYVAYATKFSLRILPSGAAMKLCQDKHPLVLDPVFDYKNPRHPDLPVEQWSLHVGPTWRKQPDGSFRFIDDCEHAGALGKYLINCVWFEMLFGKDAREIKFKPDGIPDPQAREMRLIAHEALQSFVQPAGHLPAK